MIMCGTLKDRKYLPGVGHIATLEGDCRGSVQVTEEVACRIIRDDLVGSDVVFRLKDTADGERIVEICKQGV